MASIVLPMFGKVWYPDTQDGADTAFLRMNVYFKWKVQGITQHPAYFMATMNRNFSIQKRESYFLAETVILTNGYTLPANTIELETKYSKYQSRSPLIL